MTNPEGKQRARDFIKKTFQDLGLHTWSEEFKPDPVFSQVNFKLEIGKYLLYKFNINLLVFYHEYSSLIGGATHYIYSVIVSRLSSAWCDLFISKIDLSNGR